MTLRVPPVALRRVANPLWLPGAVLLTVPLLLGLVVGGLAALTPGQRRLLRLSALALTYVWVDVSILVACWWLWLCSPLPRRDLDTWRQRHATVLGWALRCLLARSESTVGFHLELENPAATQDRGRPLVVLARHAGPGDSFALVHLLLEQLGRRPKVVLKEVLQLDPGLDVLLNRLDCYFLPSRSGAGEDRTEAVRRLAQSLTAREALLIFPEGGNWTPRRHRRAVRRLFRRGESRRARRAAEHPAVLPPRPGGAVACLTARDDTDVVVVAHAGLDTLVNPGQMWRAIPVHDRPMRVSWWVTDADRVPRTQEAAQVWVENMWARVDTWVRHARAVATAPAAPTA
ncbi:1-acyl-sn-glycerol-3-phosphate acyltransferase [Pedococcus sp. NPDC057267]|uniref:1-acyl-sn-glycerol-3-phosphate acyltransferase n=1 Tax=Pedococcus sp. NPDC057267 TaxID=3346077 RepID=UPI0036303451